jgi:putative membrane protein
MSNNSARPVKSVASQAVKNWGILEKSGNELNPDQLTIKLTIREIIFAGLANGKSLVYLLIGLGVIFQFINNLNLDELILKRGEAYVDMIISYGVIFIFGIIIFVLLLSWLASIAAFILRNYNFQIVKGENKLEITRGLISRLTVQITTKRIQELRIRQDVISRIFGYATIELRLAVSKVQDGKQRAGEDPSKVILHPFIKLENLDAFISEFLADYNGRPKSFSPLPRPALRRSIIRHLRVALGLALILLAQTTVWFLIGSIPKIIPIITATVLFFLIIHMVITGYFAYKNAGITIENNMLAISRGAYIRQHIFIPIKKIQISTLSQNPLQKRHNLFTYTVNTIGSGAYLYDIHPF